MKSQNQVLNYNDQYLNAQIKDLKAGRSIYIYDYKRKVEIDNLLKSLDFNVSIKCNFNEYKGVDYWIYCKELLS